MRIGDVGAVSHAGDLLAFSLAVVIVLSLIYGVGTIGSDEPDEGPVDWVFVLGSIRTWKGFDPDGDGILEMEAISCLDSIKRCPFPLNGDVTVFFRSVSISLGFHFSQGSLDSSVEMAEHRSIVHGCTVLIDNDDVVIPCIMEVSIYGGSGK
ncbi:MAG: hypothetical protein JW939_09735 [Candidatus Thermoplasmatota archaeon]|nr:hypothetical protein [Candidatus Thermoplasmatota archaeon]